MVANGNGSSPAVAERNLATRGTPSKAAQAAVDGVPREAGHGSSPGQNRGCPSVFQLSSPHPNCFATIGKSDDDFCVIYTQKVIKMHSHNEINTKVLHMP